LIARRDWIEGIPFHTHISQQSRKYHHFKGSLGHAVTRIDRTSHTHLTPKSLTSILLPAKLPSEIMQGALSVENFHDKINKMPIKLRGNKIIAMMKNLVLSFIAPFKGSWIKTVRSNALEPA